MRVSGTQCNIIKAVHSVLRIWLLSEQLCTLFSHRENKVIVRVNVEMWKSIRVGCAEGYFVPYFLESSLSYTTLKDFSGV